MLRVNCLCDQSSFNNNSGTERKKALIHTPRENDIQRTTDLKNNKRKYAKQIKVVCLQLPFVLNMRNLVLKGSVMKPSFTHGVTETVWSAPWEFSAVATASSRAWLTGVCLAAPASQRANGGGENWRALDLIYRQTGGKMKWDFGESTAMEGG